MIKYGYYITVLLALVSCNSKMDRQGVDDLVNQALGLGDSVQHKAIELSMKAYAAAEEINYTSGMANSRLLASRNSVDLGDFKTALRYATDAEQLSRQARDADKITEAIRLKAISYTGLGFYDKGRREVAIARKQAERIADKGLKYFRIGFLCVDMAVNLDWAKMSTDTVIYWHKKGYEAFKKIDTSYSYYHGSMALASGNVGLNYLVLKKTDSASRYLHAALHHTDAANNQLLKSHIVRELGKLHHHKHEYDSASFRYKQAEDLAQKLDNPYILREVYEAAAETYEAVGDLSTANSYLNRFTQLNDSLIREEKSAAEVVFTQAIEEESSLLDNARFRFGLIVVGVLVILGLLCFICIWFFSKYKSEKMRKIQWDKLVHEKQTEIEELNRMDAHKRLVALVNEGNPGFFEEFVELYPDFRVHLLMKAETLREHELEVCALLKMAFKTKEIAHYMGISVRAVENAKYAVRKKLRIPTTMDLCVYIYSI